jgi:peptide/nickel transport system substrate-binding protein
MIAGTLLALALAAACGRTPPPPATPHPSITAVSSSTASAVSTSTLDASTSPTQPPTSSPQPTATAGPRTITVGLAHAPGALDPASAADQAALLITRHMYEGLTAYEPGSTRVVPALAESWLVSPDELTWTFRLRTGVRFSDGTAFDATAARLNFLRWMNASPPGEYLFWRAMFGGFAGDVGADGEPLSLLADVSAPDARTLVLTLRRPDASLPATLAMPSFAVVSPSSLQLADPSVSLTRASAGTGPYALAGAPASEIWRLKPVAGYWRPAAVIDGPDELVFKVITDDTQRLLALQTGEIEAIAQVNPRDYAAVSAPGYNTRLVFSPPLNVLYLGLNHARAPWNILDCRLAVAHALNSERYTSDYFPGDGLHARAMHPPGVWGSPGATPLPTFDPAVARRHWEACQAAGGSLPDDAALYVPPIERHYLPQPAQIGSAIQADLAAVGITMAIASPDWHSAWLPDVHGGRADLFVLGWHAISGDPDSFWCPLFCGLESSFNNDGRGLPLPPDAELASILQEARTVSDIAAREALYARASERFSTVLPAIPLVHRQAAWALRTNVAGFVLGPAESLLFNAHVIP